MASADAQYLTRAVKSLVSNYLYFFGGKRRGVNAQLIEVQYLAQQPFRALSNLTPIF
jgi:hypothetical protein